MGESRIFRLAGGSLKGRIMLEQGRARQKREHLMSFFQSENITIDVEGDLALLKIDVPGRGVNLLNRQAFRDLDAALDRLATRTNLQVLVVKSGKKAGFVAGADIQQFADIKSPQEA